MLPTQHESQYFDLCDTLSVLERILKNQVEYLVVTPVRGPLLPNTGPSEPLQTKLFGEYIYIYTHAYILMVLYNYWILYSC